MICYLDMTFCSARCATTACSRNWTAQIVANEKEWANYQKWSEGFDFNQGPVAFSDFSDSCPKYEQP